MLARSALGRLAADVPTARTHVPQLARSLQRCLLVRNASNLPAARAISRAHRTALVDARRSYATTTRATKPAEPVKKETTTKTTTKAAPKAAPKKTTTTTTTTKTIKGAPKAKTKAAAEPKATKKPAAKKAAPKKAAPKKRVKKVPTPEEQLKSKVRELRKVALKEPFALNQLHGRNIFVGELLNGSKDAKKDFVDASKRFNTLAPEQVAHYNHLATQKNAERAAEFKAWVQSYTPEEIRLANNARVQLRRILKDASKRRYPAHTTKLPDDRQAKRPLNPFLRFFTERRASGDYKNIVFADVAKAISTEWKALDASEKSKYEKQFEGERAQLAAAKA